MCHPQKAKCHPLSLPLIFFSFFEAYAYVAKNIKIYFLTYTCSNYFLIRTRQKQLLNQKSDHDNNFLTKTIVVMNRPPWETEALIGGWLWTALVNEAFQRPFISFQTVTLKGHLHLIVLVASTLILFYLLLHKPSQHSVYMIFVSISRISNS